MPDLLLRRSLKNFGIALVLLILGILFGITMKDFSMFAIPAALSIFIGAQSILLLQKYKKGRVFVMSCECIGSTRAFIPTRSDYIFKNKYGEVATVKGRAQKEFQQGFTYDLLFQRTEEGTPPSLIDAALSDLSFASAAEQETDKSTKNEGEKT